MRKGVAMGMRMGVEMVLMVWRERCTLAEEANAEARNILMMVVSGGDLTIEGV